MAIIIDTKIFVLLVLYAHRLNEEFKECIRESKPINIDEETCVKNIVKIIEWIIKQIALGGKIYITPQILAEFSNWIGKYVKDIKYKRLMKETVINLLKKNSSEYYIEMNKILQEEENLIKFGFTDMSIYLCSKEIKDKIIITSEKELSSFCRSNGIRVLNVYEI